ncbi:hypothetical protein [Brevundimonas aurifodinae]|uniref:DUF1206 domain-containing protein n=1 Tax=Brevundimonas aurifodinae TaxID=1508312 RepID=A0ABV1NK53_9CAUL
MTEPHPATPVTRLRALRVASAGAFGTLWLFVLGWIWAAFSLPGAEAFLGLFTTEPASSARALLYGGLCAFVVGGLFGAIIAHCYNLAGRFIRD